MSNKYHSILTEMSQRLSKGDLSNLVYSYGNILPASIAEQITTGTHLFRELTQRGHLGPANFDYLRKQLVLVGRHDLASMLPDQFEILFGQSATRDEGYFGCFVSPTAPDMLSNMVIISSLKYCHYDTSMESRMFLLQLSQQLNSEDVKKLAFLMYPAHSQLTTLKVAELLEKEGGLHSLSLINRLSGCLEAIGRVDLAQQLNLLKMPQALVTSNSLSTSQQQLNLKMSLLLHSKQRSFDFYMRALSEVECNSEARTKLLGPIYARFQASFSSSSITQLIHNLQEPFEKFTTANRLVELYSLINDSFLEGLKLHHAFSTRMAFLRCKEIPVEKLWQLTQLVNESYNSFDSLMNVLNWNSSVRCELKRSIECGQCRSPFGTPAELACKYIHDILWEVGQGGKIYQEKQITDRHIQALNSNYYCCCYHIIVLQWLASLLCFFTSFKSAQIDLSTFKETLWYILQQKREEIMQSYSHIANIVGHAILQKFIPSPNGIELGNGQPPPNPFVLLFNVLIIKLLAVVSTLSADQTLSNYYLIDHDQTLYFCSQMIMVSAAAMKKEVKAFREKVLSEDPLCSHVIAALTD